MPVLDTTNMAVVSANARAADVAEKAIKEIMPEMQQRYMSAFRPQGVQCIHYNRLNSGRKCSCQASRKQINGLLGKDGKADIGTINSLITGNSDFGVTPYNQNQNRVTGVDATETSPYAPLNKFQGVFDILTDNNEIPMADLLGGRDSNVGDNGPVESVSIEDMVADFDAGSLGFTDVACPICFGTGFVGGFAPFHGHRQVLTVMDMQIDPSGSLDLLKAPFVANAASFNVIVKLPRGAIGVDIFRVLNGDDPTPSVISIDGNKITSISQILNYCDGRQHIINATNLTSFTHLEIQFALSTESIYFEFPRRPTSANTALLEQTEPFQVILSPNVPTISSQDIIVEQMLGKVLVVQNVNPWNSRDRNILGWDVMVRVIQPMELYRLLPGRGRTRLKDQVTSLPKNNGFRTP